MSGDLRYMPICRPCIAGEGPECHTPGCGLFMRDVPEEGLIEAFAVGYCPSEAPGQVVALSEWIDAGNKDRAPEAATWARLAKVSEECGEVVAAFIGATGQNPRKGVTHSMADVVDELLDVAITALGAVEHVRQHDGLAFSLLEEKVAKVAERAGLERAS